MKMNLLTILIPTFNRPDFLNLNLEYYKSIYIKYPIFIAHQHEAKIGELIIDKDEFSTDWNIHASTLEEFIEKGIINAEKKEFFIQNYKEPNKFICVFVMVPEGANFVFYPYK